LLSLPFFLVSARNKRSSLLDLIVDADEERKNLNNTMTPEQAIQNNDKDDW
jgi:hypothetical protein